MERDAAGWVLAIIAAITVGLSKGGLPVIPGVARHPAGAVLPHRDRALLLILLRLIWQAIWLLLGPNTHVARLANGAR